MAFLAGAVGVNLDEGPGLVATQTLTFVFADIAGSAAMARRLGTHTRRCWLVITSGSGQA